MHPALADVAALLACPECGLELEAADRALRCGSGHSFDIAKQGYVSLLTGSSTKMTGDTPAMLDARAAFQGAGHFAPIARAVVGAIGATLDDAGPVAPIVEVGAGTGYYLTAILDAAPESRGIAVDVAKPAARRCARAHPRAASVLADAWRGLPLRTRTVSRVLAAFAPRNPAEVARVLEPGGRFVVVTPTSGHLGELVGRLGMVTVDPDKQQRLTESLAGHFSPIERVSVEYPMTLSRTDVAHVVGMGPSAFHAADGSSSDALDSLDEDTEVTASVVVAAYRPL
ncbi:MULTISPECIES: putative RNA methyltransferase [Nocardia]|uniref:putative RNA methyltransferase n=1 Tax=Nocardia TaxID=1817 RepID=UPI000D694480|nr:MULTISPECIES: methyltransferase domain-containing protein [Nocardia]